MIYEELINSISYYELARKYNVIPKTLLTWQQKLRHPDKYQVHDLKRGKKRN